ncbi:hypothetical protein VNN36_06205 [Lactococcus garvieae]|uniref:hypothetical protein n=1 Tax=Lactococcus garvieae TaxID=1363 RepID=UPI0030CD9122
MKTKAMIRHEFMELYLSQIIRKNLTIRSLSMMLGNMMTELVHDPDLVIYSGNFEEINTLLDCILDESNSNDEDLDVLQENIEELSPGNFEGTNILGRIEIDVLEKLDKVLDLPQGAMYRATKQIMDGGGGD